MTLGDKPNIDLNQNYQIWGFAESGYYKDLGIIKAKSEEDARKIAFKKFGIVRNIELI